DVCSSDLANAKSSKKSPPISSRPIKWRVGLGSCEDFVIVINRIVFVANNDSAKPTVERGRYPAKALIVDCGRPFPFPANSNHVEICPAFPHLPRQNLILLKLGSLWWFHPRVVDHKRFVRHTAVAHHKHDDRGGPARNRVDLNFYWQSAPLTCVVKPAQKADQDDLCPVFQAHQYWPHELNYFDYPPAV